MDESGRVYWVDDVGGPDFGFVARSFLEAIYMIFHELQFLHKLKMQSVFDNSRVNNTSSDEEVIDVVIPNHDCSRLKAFRNCRQVSEIVMPILSFETGQDERMH